MSDDASKKGDVIKEAEVFGPAHEELSKSVAALFSAEVYQNFPKANRYGADGKKSENIPIIEQPFGFNPEGQTTGQAAAKGLQELFNRANGEKKGEKKDLAGSSKIESFEGGKGELRVLPTADKGTTAQYVDPDGRVTTRISSNVCIEFDPKTQEYTSIDASGKCTKLNKDSDPVDPSDKNSKTLKQLKDNGIASEKAEGKPEGKKTTYLDGRVATTFSEPSRLSERTTYPPGHFPPGYRSADPNDKGENVGLRQEEKFREIPLKPGENATSASARTVKVFEDRKETSFATGDISKVTAFKNANPHNPAVITDFRNNKGPDGASSIETYKNDGNPDSLRQRTKYHNGDGAEIKPDKLTFGLGAGDRSGVLDIRSDIGMPMHMRIGDNDYQVSYGADGKVASMTVDSTKAPLGHLKLERDPVSHELKVMEADGKFWKSADKTADGKFKPDSNGTINLDGLPVAVKNGEVDGEVHLNKEGDLRYISNGGPERHEIVRRANGTTEDYDFKSWTKTTTSPDGTVKQPVDRWDGYKWRDDAVKVSPDGNHVEFPDHTFTERITGGNPSRDVTVFGSKDGKPETYDWSHHTRTQTGADGKETTSYYDGSTYRAGTEQKQGSDTIIRFTPPFNNDQPAEILQHKDGTSTSNYNDGSHVEKNSKGQVTAVDGPKGKWKFERDGDGDISKAIEFGADGKEKNSYTRTGQERDPGMEQWLGREGNGARRQPSDKPPRDPNAPKDYDSWKSTTSINEHTKIEYDPVSKSYTRVQGDTRKVLAHDTDPLDPTDPNLKGKTLADFKKDHAGSANSDGMNIHTTADGTVRIECAAHGDKPAELRMRPPVGDSYQETPSHWR